MPKINETMLKLEGFKCATSLDIKMGDYYIQQFIKNISNICVIILPWGGQRYKHL